MDPSSYRKGGKVGKKSKQKEGTVYLMPQRVSRTGNQNQIHGEWISSDTYEECRQSGKTEKKSKKSGRRNETVVRSEAVSGEKRMKCYPAP
jgi:hypothetical protein